MAQGAHGGPDFAGEEALQAADDLGLGLAFSGAPGDMGLGGFVVLHPHDHDPVESRVGLAVSAAVEAVPCRHAGGGGNGRHAAEFGERGLGPDPVGVVTGHDEHLGGVSGPTANAAERSGAA